MQAVLLFASLLALYASLRHYRSLYASYGSNRWAHAQQLALVGICLSFVGFFLTMQWHVLLGTILFLVLAVVGWFFAARYRAEVLAAAKAAAEAKAGSGTPPLIVAVSERDYEGIRRLLGAGAEVDVRGVDGMTALARAVEAVDLRALRMLLLGGADPDQLIRDGWTPLQHAAHRGRVAMARMLLDAGATPGRLGLAADTALAMAAAGDYDEIVELLLSRGDDVDRPSVGGYTALMRAAEAGNSRTVRLLLSKGASVDIRAGEDEQTSALTLAVAGGHDKTVDLLLDAAIASGHREPGFDALIEFAEAKEYERIAESLRRAAAEVSAPPEPEPEPQMTPG